MPRALRTGVRPRANKGYQPGREAWRACALVLVLVFWVLGCASPNPSSPELGPTVRPASSLCQDHLLIGCMGWGVVRVLGNAALPVLALLYCWVQGPCCMVLPFCTSWGSIPIRFNV